MEGQTEWQMVKLFYDNKNMRLQANWQNTPDNAFSWYVLKTARHSYTNLAISNNEIFVMNIMCSLLLHSPADK